MELILTDTSWDEVGTLPYEGGDFELGDSNDFALKLPPGAEIPADGCLVYSEDGEVGGIVRGVESSGGEVTVTGLTWAGLLGEAVLEPAAGSAYWSDSGTVERIAARLIARLPGVGPLFAVSGSTGSGNVRHVFSGSRDSTQQDSGRYMSGWAALWQLCIEHGCKATFAYDPDSRKIAVAMSAAEDRRDDEAAYACGASVSVTRTHPPNMLVCLGQGDLAARTVVRLYADRAGNVSGSQSIAGAEICARIYDDSSAEDEATLRSHGEAKLRSLISDAMQVKVDAPDVDWDLGDVVGGTDEATGVSAEAVITRKVVKLDGGSASREYDTSVRRHT